jgi:hypothetical protein
MDQAKLLSCLYEIPTSSNHEPAESTSLFCFTNPVFKIFTLKLKNVWRIDLKLLKLKGGLREKYRREGRERERERKQSEQSSESFSEIMFSVKRSVSPL